MSNDANKSKETDADADCSVNKKDPNSIASDNARFKSDTQNVNNSGGLNEDQASISRNKQPSGNGNQRCSNGLDKIFSDSSVFKTFGIDNKLNIEYFPHTSVIRSTNDTISKLSQISNNKLNSRPNNEIKSGASDVSLEKFKESKDFVYYKNVSLPNESRHNKNDANNTKYFNMFSTSNKNEAIKSINFNAYEQFGNNNATSSFDVTLNSFKSKPATIKEACDFDRRSSATSPISDMKGSKMTPRPLKKAWLYRHTGEDELENAKFDDMAQNGINSFDKTLTKNCTDSSLTTNLNSNFYFTNLGTEKLNGIIKNNILQKNCNTLMKNNDKTYARKLFEDRAAKQGIKKYSNIRRSFNGSFK
ncbi:hybrid signal transduction histidine kinase L-like [Ctenocephalides felis]|uniref:hybrid signal transduction histidine kinase L-like n=1 Tax=Ctenocephalides felis TaxID=7515 RepID=UPI000E6E34C3|nr:hybrid signal transduction histidine kinase L-like [Ctenocephalides felis]